MAVYFNLGVDCGPDEAVRDAVVAAFPGPILGDVELYADTVFLRDSWFVGIFVKGMWYGNPGCRDELLTDTAMVRVREALYERLRSLRGYRRACFGGECYDQLAHGSPEEDVDVEYVDMVFEAARYPVPTGAEVVPFSPGYLLVVRRA